MASTGLQVVGFILGVLSWIGMIGTCASPEWRKNSKGQTVIDKTMRYEGLWTQCEAHSTGQTQCSVYDEFFIGLPGVLQVCRALMIASIALGFIAIIITILGIKCTSIGNSNPRAKARASIIGGFLFLVAAVLVGASVSYYAHGVVQEYYNPAIKNNVPMHFRMEYGSALFVGWAALVVGILGGLILEFTSVFVLLRLNAAERRGRLIPGTRVTENRTRQGTQQRQQHLPLVQHHRSAHVRVHDASRPQDDAIKLTKQHIAQHNSKLASKNGHSHHHHHHHTKANMTSSKQEYRPPSAGESSRSSGERRRWSDDNPAEQQSTEQPDGARLHHHHHHHHHQHRMNSSKSEGQIKPRSRDDGERETRTTHDRVDDEVDGGYTRRRPAKEYV